MTKLNPDNSEKDLNKPIDKRHIGELSTKMLTDMLYLIEICMMDPMKVVCRARQDVQGI